MANGTRLALLAFLLLGAGASTDAGASSGGPIIPPLGRSVTLRNGVVMPSIGLGSSGHCHPDPDGSEKSTCSNYAAALSALRLGYRSFHDALSYQNQAGLGAALHDAIAAGNVTRAEVFIMSMVPKYLMGFSETIAAVNASLQQLQLQRIDLVMIHHRAGDIGEWPRNVSKMNAFPDNWSRNGSPVSRGNFSLWEAPLCALRDPSWQLCQDETWQALVQLRGQGKIRAIGVSNWQVSNLKRMKALGQELPAVNQIEQHIGWHDSEMVDFCNANGILVQAASPIGRGSVLKHPVVLSVAGKYKKTAAQIALRYLLELGVSPIPASTTPAYQEENLGIFDFRLNESDVARLGALGIPCRGAPADGLQKCWADPSVIMCADARGRMYHCP